MSTTIEKIGIGIIIGLVIVVGLNPFLSQLNTYHSLPVNSQIGFSNASNKTTDLLSDAETTFKGIQQQGGTNLFGEFIQFVGLGAFVLLFPIRLIEIGFSAVNEIVSNSVFATLQINPVLILLIVGLLSIPILFAGIRIIRGSE